MTEIFRRSIQVDNVTDALTAIQAALAEAGWSTITGSPTSLPLVMGSGTIVNSVRIFLRFTNPTANVLRMNGDALGDATSLSRNREWTLSAGSLLWLSADADSGCCLIKPSSGSGNAYHFGRLDALIPEDGWAAQMGELLTTTSNTNLQFEFFQEHDGSTKWAFSNTSASNVRGVFTGPFTNGGDSIAGKPEIAPYFRWAAQAGRQFRGVVRFAVTGLEHKPSGIEHEGQGGKLYVSTGSGGFRVS